MSGHALTISLRENTMNNQRDLESAMMQIIDSLEDGKHGTVYSKDHVITITTFGKINAQFVEVVLDERNLEYTKDDSDWPTTRFTLEGDFDVVGYTRLLTLNEKQKRFLFIDRTYVTAKTLDAATYPGWRDWFIDDFEWVLDLDDDRWGFKTLTLTEKNPIIPGDPAIYKQGLNFQDDDLETLLKMSD